eukprot:GHVN01007151.1.p1 GENE.GHVN01007151.1~~GHVN01007151.1.p1  ORF type:complete len:149 (+),score=17.69 GHVN01007151.1:62-508(+)
MDFPGLVGGVSSRIMALDDRISLFYKNVEPSQGHLTPSFASSIKLGLTGQDYAKLCIASAFVCASLAWTQLRLRGEDPTDHPVTRELDRVKLYMKRVFVEDEECGPESKRRRTTLNREATARVIRAYTQQDEKEEEVDLRGGDKLNAE